MPNVSGIAALDVLIGLFFLYFLLSIVCSSINEAIASVLNMRAGYLERGIRTLLSREGNVKSFYSHWRVRALIKPPGKIFKGPRKPSYIPSRTFALTLLDTFAPPENAAENDDLLSLIPEPLDLVVCDASCFTTGAEKNPTLTAMALAARAAARLAADLKTR